LLLTLLAVGLAPAASAAEAWRPSDGRPIASLPTMVVTATPTTPEARERSGSEGRIATATLKCTISGEGQAEACEKLDEWPLGEGIGEAALRVAAQFRIKPGASEGLELVMPIAFVMAPEAGSAPPTESTKAAFAQAPTGKDYARLFPPAAKASSRGGEARVSCVVTSTGQATHCAVIDESPAGLGFGEAARQMMMDAKFRPATYGGRPIGSVVNIPLKFPGG
jgi:TonB family protein